MAAKSPLTNLITGMMEHAGAHGIGDTFVETVKRLMEEHGEHAARGVTVAGMAGSSALGAPILIPLAIYMTLFGVAEALKTRRESKEEAERNKAEVHIRNVLHNVERMLEREDDAVDKLVEIAERKCPVWARLSGADRATFRREIIHDLKPALEMLGTDLQSTLADHWVLSSDTNERVRHVEDLVELLVARGRWYRLSTRPLFRTTLPDRDPRFAGRAGELEELHRRLVTSGEQGIAQQAGLSAVGGVGKTSMAVEYGWTHLKDYPGGVFLIRATTGRLEVDLAVLATTLGVPMAADIPSTARAVKDYLESSSTDDGEPIPCLLIVDNITAKDHWHDSKWRDLLPRGNCRRILTTRDARLDPLDLMDLGVLSLEDAVKLLDNFRPIGTAEPEIRAAQGIARWFGGWAVGLATVGARLRMKDGLTYVQLAGALSNMGFGAVELAESDLSGLASGARPLANYEERIGAVLNDLFQQLTPAQRRLLEYAAVLPQDAVPRPWLIRLLKNETGIMLSPTLKGDDRGAEEELNRLQSLGLFVTSGELPNVLILHAVRRAWIQPRLKDRPEEYRAIRHAILEHAAYRSGWLSSVDEQGWYRWIDMTNRWELEPLALLISTPDMLENDDADMAASLNNVAFCLQSLGRSAEALPKYEAALGMLQRLFKGDHQNVAASLNNVAFCLQLLGRSAEALPKYEVALEMLQRLFKRDHLDVASSLNNVAGCLDSLGRSGEALPKYEAALEMRRRLFKGDHPDVAIGLNNVASCLQYLGRSAEALPKYEAALDMRQRLFKGDHPDVATSLNNVASCLQSLGRSAEALPEYEAALDMRQRLFKGDHPDVAASLNNFAVCLRSLGRFAEALAKYEAALEMFQLLFKADHPDVATSLNNVAFCLQSLGRSPEALPKYEAALEMRHRLFIDDHPDLAMSLNNVAFCLRSLGRSVEALPNCEAALDMRQRLFKGDHADVAQSLDNVAFCLESLGRSAAALPKFEAVLEVRQRLFKGDHSDVAASLNNVAICLQSLGRSAEALPKYEAALEMLQRLFNGDHSNVATSLNNVAFCLDSLGRSAEALPKYEAARKMRDRLLKRDQPHR